MDWICFIKACLLASVLAGGVMVSSSKPRPSCAVVPFRGLQRNTDQASLPKPAGSVFLLFIVIISPQPPFVFTPREGRISIDQMVVVIHQVNTMCSLSFSLAPFSGTVESEVFWFHWSGELKNLDLGVWSWSMGVKRVIMRFCLLFNSEKPSTPSVLRLCSYHLS